MPRLHPHDVEAFEAWAQTDPGLKHKGLNLNRMSDAPAYGSPHTSLAFRAWKAALDYRDCVKDAVALEN